MNDEDLRDFFAGLAMIGAIMNSGIYEFRAVACYSAADAMIRAKYAEEEPDVGITAIKRKYVKKEK
jgi:hypothetical protein